MSLARGYIKDIAALTQPLPLSIFVVFCHHLKLNVCPSGVRSYSSHDPAVANAVLLSASNCSSVIANLSYPLIGV